MEPNNNAELENLIQEKLLPIQKKIETLENSLKFKDEELLILNYAYTGITKQLELLKSQKKAIKLTAPAPLKKVPGRAIPPNDNTVNICLKQIKGDKLFNFLDDSTLIGLRRVCKTWDSEISKVLLDHYNKCFLMNPELKATILEQVNSIKNSIRTEAAGIKKEDLIELKSCKILPSAMNDLFIALFISLGDKLSPEDLAIKNILSIKNKGPNDFFSNFLKIIFEKNLTLSTVDKVKNYLDNPNLRPDKLEKSSAVGVRFLNIIQNKIKWEEYLINQVGKDRLFIWKGAEEFFEEIKKKNLN